MADQDKFRGPPFQRLLYPEQNQARNSCVKRRMVKYPLLDINTAPDNTLTYRNLKVPRPSCVRYTDRYHLKITLRQSMSV